MKNDPWVNSDWRAEMHVFLQEGSQKARNAHILTFFANPSYRLSILTRGSSQAEFEALLLNRFHPMLEFLNRSGIAAAGFMVAGRKRVACDVTTRVIDLTPGKLIAFEKREDATGSAMSQPFRKPYSLRLPADGSMDHFYGMLTHSSSTALPKAG